jgi:hypothetical protein
MTSLGGPPLVASNASFEAALEPVKLFQGIGKGGRHVGNRLTVQPLCLDKPGTSGRIPERAFKVARGLGVVVGALPAGRVASCNPQPRSRASLMITFGFPSTRYWRSPTSAFASSGTWSTRARPRAASPWAARRAAVSSALVGARPR